METTDIICISSPWYEQYQPLSLTVCVASALHCTRLHIGEGPLGTRLTEHILCFTAPFFHPESWGADWVGLTLCATLPRQEAVRGTRADAVLGGRAGCFLNEVCRAWHPTAMALLDAILTPCEGTFSTGATLPHGCWGAVERHIGACWALVADQLGARFRVSVLIVAGWEDGLVSWAICGQNPGWDLNQHIVEELKREESVEVTEKSKTWRILKDLEKSYEEKLTLHVTATDFCFLTSTYQNSLCQHGKHLLSEASSSFRATSFLIYEPCLLIACQPIKKQNMNIDNKCQNKQTNIMGTLEKGFRPPLLW